MKSTRSELVQNENDFAIDKLGRSQSGRPYNYLLVNKKVSSVY